MNKLLWHLKRFTIRKSFKDKNDFNFEVYINYFYMEDFTIFRIDNLKTDRLKFFALIIFNKKVYVYKIKDGKTKKWIMNKAVK